MAERNDVYTVEKKEVEEDREEYKVELEPLPVRRCMAQSNHIYRR